MKLPRGHRARIDLRRKLLGYCLNMAHRTGRNKARVFQSALGIHAGNVHLLVNALRKAAAESEARIKETTIDAVKYEVDFEMSGPAGTAWVRSGWIIERHTEVPRLSSCYVRKRVQHGHSL
jgi:hypothetical protein